MVPHLNPVHNLNAEERDMKRPLHAIAAGLAVTVHSFLLATGLSAQQREVIDRPGVTPNPNSVLSNAIKIGNMMWVSGQLGDNSGDIEKETQVALEKIKNSLQAGGFEMKDVVAVQVYLVDIKDFPKMNGVYRTFFPDAKPTRTTVQIAGLANPAARVEITATAVKAQ